jgi:hypothetical protein
MNPIFKLKNGSYVDLSRIVAIKFSATSNSDGILGLVSIQFARTVEDMIFKNESGIGEVVFEKLVFDVEESIIEYALGPMIKHELLGNIRDYSERDTEKAKEIVKNKTIEEYQHLIDAWEKYKNVT